jgi:hypothetical protein
LIACNQTFRHRRKVDRDLAIHVPYGYWQSGGTTIKTVRALVIDAAEDMDVLLQTIDYAILLLRDDEFRQQAFLPNIVRESQQ